MSERRGGGGAGPWRVFENCIEADVMAKEIVVNNRSSGNSLELYHAVDYEDGAERGWSFEFV